MEYQTKRCEKKSRAGRILIKGRSCYKYIREIRWTECCAMSATDKPPTVGVSSASSTCASTAIMQSIAEANAAYMYGSSYARNARIKTASCSVRIASSSYARSVIAASITKEPAGHTLASHANK